MTQANQRGSAHTIVVIVLIIVTMGTLGYSALQSYLSSNQGSFSSANNNKTVDEMLNVIKMQMTKTDVDNKIGTPVLCTPMQRVDIDSENSETQHCEYGDPKAKGIVDVTYMNNEVWGVTFVKKN